MTRIAGLILAGGEARRMQGQDKGLVKFKNKPLIEYVIASLKPQVDELWISANRHLEEYRALGLPVIMDLPEFKGMGPLAGLVSLLPHLSGEITHVQMAACDTPFLSPHMTSDLLNFLEGSQTQAQATMPALNEHVHQYSCLLIRRQALQGLADYLRTDSKRSIRGFLAPLPALPCYSANFTLQHMRNFNTHEEIAQYIQDSSEWK